MARSGSFFGESSNQQLQEEAFSPRVGVVYQPIEPLSLYASFTQSFAPNSTVDAEGNILEPERGEQYEVGIKGEFFDGNLSATLAAYNLNNPSFMTIGKSYRISRQYKLNCRETDLEEKEKHESDS